MNIDIFFEFNIKRRRRRKKILSFEFTEQTRRAFSLPKKNKKKLKINIINFSNHENRYPRKQFN